MQLSNQPIRGIDMHVATLRQITLIAGVAIRAQARNFIANSARAA